MAKKDKDEQNVVALPGAPEPPKEAGGVTAVVDLLDHLLAEARKGNLRAVAVAGVRKSGATLRTWAQEDAASIGLAAAVGDLFYAVHADRDDNYEYPKD